MYILNFFDSCIRETFIYYNLTRIALLSVSAAAKRPSFVTRSIFGLQTHNTPDRYRKSQVIRLTVVIHIEVLDSNDGSSVEFNYVTPHNCYGTG
jgi:hypothetical protein